MNLFTTSQTGVLKQATTVVKAVTLAIALALVLGTTLQSGHPQADRPEGQSTSSSASAGAATGSATSVGDATEPGYELVGFDPWRGLGYSAQKTARFAGCIFGVGVPIGLAWGIATNPAAWAWVLGRGPWPASVGGSASRYMVTVKRWCSYALR